MKEYLEDIVEDVLNGKSDDCSASLDDLCQMVYEENDRSLELVFHNGAWHRNGTVVSVPPNVETRIIETISRIESANYTGDLDYLAQLGDAMSMDDLFDYMECGKDDAFIYYYDGSGSALNEFESPSSRIPDLKNIVYLMATKDMRSDKDFSYCSVEIADLCGNIRGPGVARSMLGSFVGWMNEIHADVMFASCREKTSYRLFAEGSPVVRRLAANGFSRVDTGTNGYESGEDERFHTIVFMKNDEANPERSRRSRRLLSYIKGHF